MDLSWRVCTSPQDASASATSALADFFVGCFGFMKGFVVSGAALKREKFSTANRVDERIKAPELRRISFGHYLRRVLVCHVD